jgi:hypothetical protein
MMPEVKDLSTIDGLCQQARSAFRANAAHKQAELSKVFTLLIDVFRSVGKMRSPEQWTGTKEEAAFEVLIQAIETTLSMYYLSESGFWDNALAMKRNVSELLLTAIAVGYDQQCFVDWKHSRSSADSFERLFKRVSSSQLVPDVEKSLLPHLKRYWVESSERFSHNISRKSIRTISNQGQFQLEPKAASSEFRDGRINTIRNIFLNVLSIALGMFRYDRVAFERRADFPEAQSLISRANECFQNESWKRELTT